MEYGLVLTWLVLYGGLGVLALPICAMLFSRFPDRGAGLAIPVALATVGVGAYLVGQIAFGWPAALAGVGLLAVGSVLSIRRLRARWLDATTIEPAVVFTVAFLAVVAVRAVDPGVQPLGGEKFLDYGLLRSLLRAPVLPPEDMWFAGEPVQYYYGGQMIAAVLARLTGTEAAYAYNLALAGFYASLVTAVWGLGGAVAEHRAIPRRRAAGLSLFLVGVAGNLHTAGRTVLWLLPDGLVRPLAAGLGVGEPSVSWAPGQFSYWSASRVVPLRPADPDSISLITEFPAFAWLNGDLHAHMISPTFLVVVMGLCLAYWQTPREAISRRRMLVGGAIPPVAGLIGIVNTWSLPTALGLVWLTLAFGPGEPLDLLPTGLGRVGRRLTPDGGVPTGLGRGIRRELRQTGGAGLVTLGVALVAVVWSGPFWLGTASGRAIGILSLAERSPGGALLLVHGGFLVVFGAALAGRVRARLERPVLAALVAVGSGALLWELLGAGLALTLPVLGVAWFLGRRSRRPSFELVLVIGGLGLVALVELVYVAEEAGPGRLNTLFKLYAQVWVIWSVAAGVMLAELIGQHTGLSGTVTRVRLRGAGRMLLALVVVLSMGSYAAFALPQHFDRASPTTDVQGPTLDAEAFIAIEHPEEAAAIAWVSELEGTPTLVTAAPGGYRWQPEDGQGASAAASLTGVPTVAGWSHERGYRGAEPYAKRVAAVETIYTGSQQHQNTLLARYDVAYVYVGPAERSRYGTLTIERNPALGPAASFETVTIYRVDRSALG